MAVAKISNPKDSVLSNKGKLALIFIVIVLGGFLIVALLNYFLNPLMYRSNQLREAGAALTAGKNIAFPEPTFDFRRLRRAHIEQMTEKPDIVIFSGSRWQEATSDIAPNHRFYNSFVSSDHVEDMMAISELLYAHDRMPQTLILSVRYTTFNHIGDRGKSSWKSFSSEYHAMAERLGLESHSWLDTVPYDKWLNLLSLDALIETAGTYFNIPTLWTATDELFDQQLDIIGSDGGLRFSGRHLDYFSPEFVKNDSAENASRDVKKRISINPASLEAVKALLTFLQGEGVRVVFAQTPFYPDYYEKIRGSEYFEDIGKVEAEMNKIADEYQIDVVGSFDPEAVGCVADDFRDYHHANLRCVKQIFDTIPDIHAK